ncbi:MAG: fluoride efflux transporter CrcB [Desulfofustis sp.]|nr:fluoride efflux transporter CrcB [Desulfofustis sp.]NNK12753.1 fluoride efflux transporter CrcB [Desulfofustis sp.]
MIKILAVALGGAIGSVGRYLTSLAIESYTTSRFPYETLTANLVGCFFIGLLWGYFERMSISNEFRLFLFTGVLGGYTTFSTFARENIQFFKAGEPFSALGYILISNIIGLTLVAAGFLISTQVVNSN